MIWYATRRNLSQSGVYYIVIQIHYKRKDRLSTERSGGPVKPKAWPERSGTVFLLQAAARRWKHTPDIVKLLLAGVRGFTLRIGGVFHVKSSCLLWFDFVVLCRFLADASNTSQSAIKIWTGAATVSCSCLRHAHAYMLSYFDATHSMGVNFGVQPTRTQEAT